VNEISLASADKVEEITGSPAGFAGPRGLKKEADIIADFSAANVVNGITGANRKDCHFVNMNMKRDFKVKAVLDLRMVRAGDVCPACGKELAFSRGIEVGHTFKLGTKYSDAMKAKFLDRQGREKPFIMGCYGIGVSRIVAAAIEQSHDEKGIIWNPSIAPFGVLVLALNYEDAGIRDASEKIYKDLASRGYEVLLDDRPEHPGVKFNDADLIGIPVRITIGRKTLEDGGRVEIKLRKESKHRKINMDEVLKEVKLLSGQKRTAADTT